MPTKHLHTSGGKMNKISSVLLRTHVQNYIRVTLADQLRNAGFICKKNHEFCWYRVHGDSVVQSIYFYTQHNYLPAFLEIGFGTHPLFLTPIFPTNPLMRNLPGNEILYPRYILMDRSNRYCYSDDILISCPEDEQYGSNLIDSIIDVLNSVESPHDCYELHKQWRKNEISNGSWIDVSTHFVDEVIFWDDCKLFPFCENYVYHRCALLQNALRKSPTSSRYIEELNYLQLLGDVLESNNRELYEQLLMERKKRTICMLKKHVGIDILSSEEQ